MTGNFSVKAALTNSANYLIAAIYDPSTSTPTWLESQAPIKSGTFPYYPPSWPVTFLTNLTSGKTYLIIIWECASNETTSAPTGTTIVYGTFEPSANTTTVRSDLYLTYGTSTGFTNNTTYVDTTLEGWGISVENIGYGTLKPGTDYTFDSTTGTIVFATPLNTGQNIVIHFLPQVSSTSPTSSAFSSGEIITASRSLTSSDLNKAIYVQSATSSISLPLPPLSTVTDYQYLYIFSNGGSHINAIFPCSGSDKILYKSLITGLILGQCETLRLFKANGVWNVDGNLDGVDRVGYFEMSLGNNLINTTAFDGGLRLRSQYPRLWAWALANGVIISDTLFNATDANGNFINQGFFTSGDGSTTFRMPKLTNYFLRPAASAPGVFNDLQLLAHAHATNYSGVGTYGKGPVQVSDGFSSNPTLATDLVSGPTDFAGNILSRTGAENRPSNVNYYLLCRT